MKSMWSMFSRPWYKGSGGKLRLWHFIDHPLLQILYLPQMPLSFLFKPSFLWHNIQNIFRKRGYFCISKWSEPQLWQGQPRAVITIHAHVITRLTLCLPCSFLRYGRVLSLGGKFSFHNYRNFYTNTHMTLASCLFFTCLMIINKTCFQMLQRIIMETVSSVWKKSILIRNSTTVQS